MKRKLALSALLSMVAVGSMSVGVYAGSNLEEIKAYLNMDVKIKVNGQDWQAKDSDGNPQYPITYDGSTYLPVRAAGEALGVKVGYDADTNTVLLGDSPTTNAAGTSRSNPAPVGTKVNFSYKDIIDEYAGTISVDQIIRGADAWKMISAANLFNDEPQSGYEYLVAKITVGISSNKKQDAQVRLSGASFTMVSSEGKDYDLVMAVPPSPEISASLYAGASHTGYAVFQVKKDDQNPVIAFGRKYDGSGGYWFKTK